MRRLPNVNVHGYYRAGALPSLLARYGIGLIVLPSIVPETFSLVLSEARLAGVAVVSQVTRPRLVTGLPDDADLRAATALVGGRTLHETGRLRFTSALLGEGGVGEAFTALEQMRARRAELLATRARDRHPWDARAWAALGALEVVQGNWRGAERSYRAALDRTPHFGEARLGLGVTLALRARLSPEPFRPRALELAAIAQFAAVPESDPAYEPALWNRATLLTQVVAEGVADGLIARSGRSTGRAADEKPEPGVVAADEPLAEWERELLEGKKGEAQAPPAAEA